MLYLAVESSSKVPRLVSTTESFRMTLRGGRERKDSDSRKEKSSMISLDKKFCN